VPRKANHTNDSRKCENKYTNAFESLQNSIEVNTGSINVSKNNAISNQFE
jgi:hypothetical protein